MTTTLLQFGKNENFTVLVVEVPPTTINAIVGAINPREIFKKETEHELNIVIERFVANLNLPCLCFYSNTDHIL